MVDDPLADLDTDEREALAELAKARTSDGLTRRDALKVLGGAGVGTMIGGGAGASMTQSAKADPQGIAGTQDDPWQTFYAQEVRPGDTADAVSLPAAETDEQTITDSGADPAASGEFRRNGSDVKVYSGGGVRNLSNVGSGGAGGGKPYATVVVAASDAKTTSGADYVCDGTDDHLQINSAISDLPAHGGSVVLTDGTFSVGGAVSGQGTNSLRLLGQGTATTLQLDAGVQQNVVDLSDTTEATVASMEIDGNGANQTDSGNNDTQCGVYADAVSRLEYRDLYVHDTLYANLRVTKKDGDSEDIRIVNNYLDTTHGGSAVADNNIAIAGSGGSTTTTEVQIAGNACHNSDHMGIEVANYSYNVSVVNNTNQGASAACLNPHGEPQSTRERPSVITGNTCIGDTSGGDVITLGETYGWSITGNALMGASRAGIALEYARDCIVSSNYISDVGHGSWSLVDGITLDSDSSHNLVHGNLTEGWGVTDNGTNNQVADNLTG